MLGGGAMVWVWEDEGAAVLRVWARVVGGIVADLVVCRR